MSIMFPPSTLLLKYIQASFSRKNVKGLCTFLEHMADNNLEATQIADASYGIKIIWKNGFNKTHIVEVTFYNDGLVVGLAYDVDKPGWDKEWLVTELSGPKEGYLRLSIDETLEYIRHFIWANHNV